MSDRDEWRDDVNASTEAQLYLAVQEPRWARGLVGERDDARYND